jgi:ABC-2 type transport system ATP-binding protein
MNETVIALTQIRKSYATKVILDGIDLSIPRGSVVGLVGKNGAGKSTVLKCMLGLIRSWTGSATIFGEDVRELSPAAKARIGYVAQPPSLFAWMRVGESIDYTAGFYPRWNHALTARLVQEWEIGLGERIGKLSPGQAQRLGIILALGHEPDLLVLDEPAGSLDPMARRALMEELLRIVADGKRTILFSTHITSDLERVADRIAVIKNGRLDFSGELSDLKDGYKKLILRGKSGLPEDLSIPEIIAYERRGDSAQATTCANANEIARRLAAEHHVEVEIVDLNLDDIFVELHR